MSESIDISGIDKAELLAALYNRARPQGMGFLHFTPEDMTIEQASKELDRGDDSTRMFGPRSGHRPLAFDYLRGRAMKIDISGDTLNPWGYDRDNGTGMAARIVAGLREGERKSA